MTDTNLVRFRAAVAGALAHLESRRQEVNDLNVFPVADGDTGDNMALTLRAVLAELDRLQGADEHRTIDEIGREEIVQSVARAALLGARGNSGVILSQLIRGAAEELVSRPGQLIDATLIGAALANAADRAYSSVRDPAEGTILTVAREMAHKIVTDVAHSAENPRLGPATEPREQDTAIAAALERAVQAGEDSVKRSPELLAALREAGVVDAGGYGLTIIFAGVVAALRGDEPPPLDHHAPARITHPEHSSGTYRFCTNFAVTGSGLSPSRFIAPLEELGDSVLVVGDASDAEGAPAHRPARAGHRGVRGRRRGLAPGRRGHARAGGRARRAPDRPPRRPARTRDRRRASPPPGDRLARGARCAAAPWRWSAARACASCSASSACTRSTAARRSTPRPTTCSPASTTCPTEEVVVLTNSANVIMAAEHAAELSDKQVHVAPTTSQQAGLAAAVALAPRALGRGERAGADGGARARAHRRRRAGRPRRRPGTLQARGRGRLRAGRGARLGRAARDAAGGAAHARAGGQRRGPARTDQRPRRRGRAARASARSSGMVNGGVELELRHGGQPAYWWLLAAE